MKIAIMQPYFLPYIGYWQLINYVDEFIIYDDVSYIKNGWINRNRILVSSLPHYISLKLENASSNRLINEVRIIDDDIYKMKLIKTIIQEYKKAPYFNDVYPLINNIILDKETNLSIYIRNSINFICKYLDIKTNLKVSSQIGYNTKLRGYEKVIDLCTVLGAKEYVNPIGGIHLYDKEEFNKHNIALYFLETNDDISYTQFANDFIPNLSILDILMFNSKEEVKILLNRFKLI